MIKYLTDNNEIYKNDYGSLYRDNELNNYSLLYFDLQNSWNCFSPVDLTSAINDFFSVSSNYNSPSGKHIYLAFNHSNDDNISNQGMLYSQGQNYSKIISIDMNKSYCLKGIKFKLHEITSAFNIYVKGSNDKKTWVHIDGYRIGINKQNSIESDIYFDNTVNSSNNKYLNGNPTIICKIQNENQYKFYKIYFQYAVNQTKLLISKIKLYDENVNKLICFPYENNLSDCNGDITFHSNVFFISQKKQLKFSSQYATYVAYSSSFPFNLNKCSMTFNAKFYGYDVLGTIISKSDNVFNFSVEKQLNQDTNEYQYVFQIVTAYYNYSVVMPQQSIGEDWHHYSFIFNENCYDKFYIDNELVYKIVNKDMIFYEFQYDFNIGCKTIQNNNKNNYITNMLFTNLSFYNYNIDRNIISKQMLEIYKLNK